MSIKIMSEVWDNGPEDQSMLLLLLALADHADDVTRDCWPGMERLALKCRVTVRSVQRTLRKLERDGWITTKMGGGRHHVNRYVIAPTKPRQIVTLSDEHPDTHDANPDTGVAETLTLTSPESSIEPSRETSQSKPLRIDDEFAVFWSHYPTRKGKAAARKAYEKARRGATADVLLEGLRRYVSAAPTASWAYASTWLNGERWEDEYDEAPIPDRSGRPAKFGVNGTLRAPLEGLAVLDEQDQQQRRAIAHKRAEIAP